MSRFSDDYDGELPLEMWDQIRDKALKGRPGQRQLRRLKRALELMPQKRLIDDYLAHEGDVCAVGAMGAAKLVDMGVAYEDAVAALESKFKHVSADDDGEQGTIDFAESHLGMTRTLAGVIAYRNDDIIIASTPEERWKSMYDWVVSKIIDDAKPAASTVGHEQEES